MIRISRLAIEQFGTLRSVDFRDLGSIVVVCGPNESGKSTMVEFIRRQLFGLRRPRAADHHLEAAPIGWLEFDHHAFGSGRIERAVTRSRGVDDVRILHTDGTARTDVTLNVLISGADTTLFDNVFCLAVDDLQDIAFLNESEYVQQLVGAALFGSGTSPAGVQKQLEAERDRLVKPMKGALLNDLARELTEVEARLSDARQVQAQAARSAEQLRELDQNIHGVNEQLNALRVSQAHAERLVAAQPLVVRRNELVVALGDRPQSRRTEAELDQLVQRVRDWNTACATEQRLISELEELELANDQPLGGNVVDTDLVRAVGSIAAQLGTHAEHVRTLDELRRKHQVDVVHEQRVTQRLGQWAPQHLEALDRSLDARIQIVEAVQAVVAASTTLGRSTDTEAKAEAQLAELSEQYGSAPPGMTELEIDQALEALSDLTNIRAQLDQAGPGRADESTAPVALLIGGSLSIVVGIAAAVAVSPAAAVIAVAGALAVGWYASMRFNSSRATTHAAPVGGTASVSSQLDVAASVAGVRASADVNDIRQRRGELSQLRRQAVGFEQLRRAQGTHQQAAERVASNNAVLGESRRAFSALGASLGVSPDLPPDLAVNVWDTCDELYRLRHELAVSQANITEREIEVSEFVERAHGIALQLGLPTDTTDVLELLSAKAAQLSATHEQQLERSGARTAQNDELERARKQRLSVEDELSATAAEIDVPLVSLGEAVVSAREVARLRLALDDVTTQLRPLLGSGFAHQSQSDNSDIALLEAEKLALATQIDVLEAEYRQLLEQRETRKAERRIAAQLSDVAELDARRGEIFARTRDYMHEFARNGLARLVIERTLAEYESVHQPEVFRRASELMSRLTNKAYATIHVTKEDAGAAELHLVDQSGKSWSVAQLSTGTREQLYLCVRLALAEHLAGNGRAVPLVLDDVMVDFDPERSQATASLLGDVSQHVQLVYLTCDPVHAQLMADLPGATRFDLAPRKD